MRFTKTELAFLIPAITVVVLTGCWGSRPPGPADGSSFFSGGPSVVLAHVAVLATWAAGGIFVLCGIAATLPWFPNKFLIAKVALGCLAALLTAGILHWISAHWAVLMGLCAGVLVLGGVAYLYLHRRQIERCTRTDLNGDGRVG